MPKITTEIGGSISVWSDKKRYLWALGLVVPLLSFRAPALVDLTGWSGFYWLGPMVIYLLIPIIDQLAGEDPVNPPDWAMQALDNDRYYRWLTYAYVPLQYLGYFYAAHVIIDRNLVGLDYLGLTLTVGAVGGIGIANAHELGHKRERSERRLAKVVLAQTGYGHFFVEHNRGHHLWVATPVDPASSRLGESFWRFLPRCVVGSAQSAWRLEAQRLRAQNKRVFSFDNGVLNAWAMSLLLWGVTVGIFGVRIVPFVVAQAVFGFALLEVVNYVEHYGLARQKTASGRYERCQPEHSWNSNHLVSNLFLYQLERHSDHHAHPTRRYQTLRHFAEAPQLPNGYGGMIGLAYFPPLWRRSMDRRVLAHYEGDLSRTNLQPGAEGRYRSLAQEVAKAAQAPAVAPQKEHSRSDQAA